MVVGHESYQQIGADFNEFCRSIMYLAKISCFSYSCKILSLLIHKRIYDFTLFKCRYKVNKLSINYVLKHLRNPTVV